MFISLPLSVVTGTSRTVIILDGSFKIALAAGRASMVELNKDKNGNESGYDHKWEESDPVSSTRAHAVTHSAAYRLVYLWYSYVDRQSRCQLIYLLSR